MLILSRNMGNVFITSHLLNIPFLSVLKIFILKIFHIFGYLFLGGFWYVCVWCFVLEHCEWSSPSIFFFRKCVTGFCILGTDNLWMCLSGLWVFWWVIRVFVVFSVEGRVCKMPNLTSSLFYFHPSPSSLTYSSILLQVLPWVRVGRGLFLLSSSGHISFSI